MNIKEAKNEIRSAARAYLCKNEFGEYEIPIERQRPIFLMGPPGIGKTEIMRQVAGELGISLVSYSMTHHTRQSALGLPFIVHERFGDAEYDVSEYTMSEILAEVHKTIRDTGIREGILFLDEINCVSETLAPTMLQFLQYKTFGTHRVPDGWIIVTAGNPPEYNDSVREFDIATWDRLKRIDVEPDYTAWKEYAYIQGVHASIRAYLDVKQQYFYKIESSLDGKRFVTARGWTDLSDMIRLYEKLGEKVNERLIGQYIQNPSIAKDFAVYYDLYRKYQQEYKVDQILAGSAAEELVKRAVNAKLDERLSLISLLLEALGQKFVSVEQKEKLRDRWKAALQDIRGGLSAGAGSVSDLLDDCIMSAQYELAKRKRAGNSDADSMHELGSLIRLLEQDRSNIKREMPASSDEELELLLDHFRVYSAQIRKEAAGADIALDNSFGFLENVYGEGQEVLVFVTELTIDPYSAKFISRYGCDAYYRHNHELLLYERDLEIINELEHLETSDDGVVFQTISQL